jgi:hypothetical protein
MSRKTIPVADVVEMANDMLANSADSKEQGREGIRMLLEQILHATGNYRGYSYLDGHEAVIAGTHDETRRHYSKPVAR